MSIIWEDPEAERIRIANEILSEIVRRQAPIDTSREHLDALQSEAERLLALLHDRQQGLASWHSALEERVRAIRAIV